MGFTAEGGYEEIQVVSCWMSKHGNYYLYLLAALNILLSMIASLGNILILVALWKVHSLHPPSKLLFRCLTVTDLLVGVFSQPLFASQLIFIANQRRRLCFTTVSCNEVAGGTFSTVSLFTLTTISVDRLLALRLRLSYKRKVTLRRMRGTVICFWIVSISLSSLRRFWQHALMSNVMSIVIHFLLLTSAFCYCKIYLKLRRFRIGLANRAFQEQRRSVRALQNMARYKKTVSTALWVQLALVACYLPYGIVTAVEFITGYSPSHNLAVRVAVTMALLNSSLNPFLYSWKIRGMRKALKDTIKHLICFE